ncbi:MAG: nuclear transport factor 2 family protein [Geminicoccaceae bacterium]
MARPPAEPVTHLDDGRFRVTEWRFAPGAETGWHVHGHDYVVVPLVDGTLLLEEPGGTSRKAPLTRHVPYARRTGVEHNVVNDASEPMAFLEVEVLGDALQAARLACLERFAEAWNAHDVDALMACMADDCAFQTSAGPDADGRRHEGAEAVRAAYAAVFEQFPKAAWTGPVHRVTGDHGISSWRFVGTDRQGVAVEVDGCDLFTFAGERIALKDSYRKSRAG